MCKEKTQEWSQTQPEHLITGIIAHDKLGFRYRFGTGPHAYTAIAWNVLNKKEAS